MQAQAIRSIRLIGVRSTLDFQVDHPDHNFYAEGIVVSNSHAVFYAYLTAITVFLKARYPHEFYLCLLKLARRVKEDEDEDGDEDSPDVIKKGPEYIRTIIKEMGLKGIKVLPPDILTSDLDFSIETDNSVVPPVRHVRFGLSHISGISEAGINKLTKFRRVFSTKFEVFDAAKAEGIDIRMLCSLIYSGCLQWKGTARTRLALEAQTYNLLSDTQKKRVKQFAAEYNEDIIEILRALPTKTNERGKPIFPESQLNTIRAKHQAYWDMFLNNSRSEELCAYVLERHYLGFSYSSTLHRIFSTKVANLITIEELRKQAEVIKKAPPLPEGAKPVYQPSVHIVAFVEYLKQGVSRTGTPYLRGEIVDDTGAFSIMVYGEERMEACLSFNGRAPEEGDIVLCTGSLSKEGTMLFLSSCIVQPNPIQTKRTNKS